MFIYERIATFWYNLRFSCISLAISVSVNRFRQYFYKLRLLVRPTPFGNFSSVAYASADLRETYDKTLLVSNDAPEERRYFGP